MSNEQIIFYDLPSRPPSHCWSPNPWKTRILLNYKGLNYKTEWVEYPDVKPKFEKHVPPNSEGFPYTIPTILLPNGEYTMDSRKIATRLEELYPTPSIHLDSPYQSRIEEIMPGTRAVVSDFIYKVPTRVLNEASIPYWRSTREKMFGKTLEQVNEENGNEKAWAPVRPLVKKVGDMLREHPEGPFFEGEKPTYADFVWVAFLHACQVIGTEILDGVLKEDRDVHVKLLEACKPWTERND